MGTPQEEWATPAEADATRGVLGAFAAGVGDGVEARLVPMGSSVRTRVRRRRAVKAVATGGAACVLVGALVVGGAQASSWRDASRVVPAGTATSTPTAPSPTTPTPTPTHTAPRTTGASEPTADAAPGSVITATYEDGFAPSHFSVKPGFTALVCGAPESGLQTLKNPKGYDLQRVGPWVASTSEKGATGHDATFRYVVPRLDTPFMGGDPSLVLVQGGTVVDFLGDGWGDPSFETPQGNPEYLGAASFERTVWFADDGASNCSSTGVDVVGYPSKETPRHAAGSYVAYAVAPLLCDTPDDVCGNALDEKPMLVSDPFVVTIAQDGTVTATAR